MSAFGISLAAPIAHALPLACSGHLLIDLPIFMGPVLVLVGWLLVMTRRARRAEGQPGGARPGGASDGAWLGGSPPSVRSSETSPVGARPSAIPRGAGLAEGRLSP